MVHKIVRTKDAIALGFKDSRVFNPFNTVKVQKALPNTRSDKCGSSVLLYSISDTFYKDIWGKMDELRSKSKSYPIADFGCEDMGAKKSDITTGFSLAESKVVLAKYIKPASTSRLLASDPFEDVVSKMNVNQYTIQTENLEIVDAAADWEKVEFNFYGIDADDSRVVKFKLGDAYIKPPPSSGSESAKKEESSSSTVLIIIIVIIVLLLILACILGGVFFYMKNQDSSGTGYADASGSNSRSNTDLSQNDNGISSIL